MPEQPRITANKVMALLDDHLRVHENKIDPKTHNHHIILFGDRGDDGLCAESKEMGRRITNLEKTSDKIDKLFWAVIVAIVIQLALAGMRAI